MNRASIRKLLLIPVFGALVASGMPTNVGALLWPVDPQNTAPTNRIFQIFGDWNGIRIHDGLDFQGPIGTQIKSIEAGVVIAVQPDPNGKDQGIVIIGTSQGANEAWKYGHLDFPAAVLQVLIDSKDNGTVLPAGTHVGNITDFLGGTLDHMHLERSAPDGTSIPKNPFNFYSGSDLPSLAPILDPAKIVFVPDGASKNSPFFSEAGIPQISKAVDILAEAHNQVGILTSAGVHRISYRVLDSAGGTAVAERTLANFNQFPFSEETAKFNIAYAPGSNFNSGYYVTTNSGDQAPSTTNGLSNAIENAWFTHAKIGANNGSGPLVSGDLARSNADAKYPDGKYTVGVRVDDFNPGGALLRERVVNVRNWRPATAKTTIKDSQGVIKRRLQWLWNAIEGLYKKVSPFDVSMGPGTYTIEIEFSEPVKNPTLSINTIGALALTSSEPAENQKTFTATLVIDETTGDGLKTLSITAKDLGGDDILAIGPNVTQIDPATQLARAANGTLLGTGGTDTSVSFPIARTHFSVEA